MIGLVIYCYILQFSMFSIFSWVHLKVEPWLIAGGCDRRKQKQVRKRDVEAMPRKSAGGGDQQLGAARPPRSPCPRPHGAVQFSPRGQARFLSNLHRRRCRNRLLYSCHPLLPLRRRGERKAVLLLRHLDLFFCVVLATLIPSSSFASARQFVKFLIIIVIYKFILVKISAE